MPNRGRINYQTLAVYAGPSPATGYFFSSGTSGTNLINVLTRIQSYNDDFSVNRVNVNQFGELAEIDRPIINSPTATATFDYLLANFSNEYKLGFVVNGTCNALSGILNKTADERNYFLKIASEGVDANGDTTSDTNVATIGLGNGFLNNYSFKAAVGSFPMVTVGVEGLNLVCQSTASGFSPAVNPSNGVPLNFPFTLPTAVSNPGTGDLDISVLRPGDITVTLTQRNAPDEGILVDATGAFTLPIPGSDIANGRIQDFNLSFGLSREAINALGYKYAKSREINFPVEITASVDAILGDLTTGSLGDLVTCDKSYDLQVDIRKPVSCNASVTQPIMCQYKLKNARLNSISNSNSIGANSRVSLNFTSQLGGPLQTEKGLFLSGIYA